MSQPRRQHVDGDEGDGEEEEEAAPRWIMQVVATFVYEPEERDELGFEEGDVLNVTRVQSDGWWQGYNVNEPRRVGVFPSNYVKVQHRRPPAEPPQQAHARRHIPQQQNTSRKQQSTRVSFSHRDPGDDEDEEEDDGEGQPRTVQLSARKSSVLELKQRLVDAERMSQAARKARLRAEREQTQRRSQTRNHTVRRHYAEDDDDDDGEDKDDDRFYTQAQWDVQRQRHRAYNDDDGDEGQDTQDDDADEAEQGAEEEEEEEEAESDGEDQGSFAVPVAGSERMAQVIADYAERRVYSAEEQASAATRIAHQYRGHRRSREMARRREQAGGVIAKSLHRHMQQSREQKQRQATAAVAIQRWLIDRRVQSAKYKLDRGQEHEDQAARTLQRWMRQRVAYLRWLVHVKAKCELILRRRAEQEAERLRERREKERLEREVRRQREDKEQRGQQQELNNGRANQRVEMETMTQEQPTGPNKSKTRVLKKEAVDMVKAMVVQQLNDKLRSHDEQLLELQRMVSRLQDVVRQQNGMIQRTTDQLLDVERTQPSKHRQPPPSTTTLPQVVAPSAVRPSGIKPPRPIDRPGGTTKLPMLGSKP